MVKHVYLEAGLDPAGTFIHDIVYNPPLESLWQVIH